jgi:hypothetical protein
MAFAVNPEGKAKKSLAAADNSPSLATFSHPVRCRNVGNATATAAAERKKCRREGFIGPSN